MWHQLINKCAVV